LFQPLNDRRILHLHAPLGQHNLFGHSVVPLAAYTVVNGRVARWHYSRVVLTAGAMVSAVGYTSDSRAGLKGIWTLAVPSRCMGACRDQNPSIATMAAISLAA